jgi:plasmid stabilization system protein ParE
MTTAYVGRRHQGALVVIRLPEGTELTPERSLDLVKHSPSGFEVGYRGSGPAQLACGLLLDYYDDARIARKHYIAFRNRVISQLECDGPAACWHLSGEELDAAMATITDDIVALPDGGQPSPTLPENWRTVTRPDRRVFQRTDRDHYIVLDEGVNEWLVVLCSQGDRAYPAPLASRTVSDKADVERAIHDLADESNHLIEPREGEY